MRKAYVGSGWHLQQQGGWFVLSKGPGLDGGPEQSVILYPETIESMCREMRNLRREALPETAVATEPKPR